MEKLDSDKLGSRRETRVWSQDTIVALVLTIAALTALGVAWRSSGSREAAGIGVASETYGK
jgi:hypothetical protein